MKGLEVKFYKIDVHQYVNLCGRGCSVLTIDYMKCRHYCLQPQNYFDVIFVRVMTITSFLF